ncbi:MAG: cobalt ECF transporter T component CbiQ [Rubellimicrobium sp.]|nr:cobalt ECF transporter T component CbiQ [Rubellimicrobium sp.]
MAERAGGLGPGDARVRLVVALALAFGMAAVRDLRLVPVLAVVVLVVVALAGARGGLLRRLRGPAFLAGGIVLALGLMLGETELARLGPVALRAEGLAAGALIAARLLAIVAVTVTLLAPVPPMALAGALRGIGLPGVMADLVLLTLRYLDELRAEIGRAQLARRLRGGGAGWRALPEQGMILAAALIRAEARAERIWAAMRLRGHGSAEAAPAAPVGWAGRSAVMVALLAALALVLIDRAA